jgi:FkbM family methyltransferase
MRWDEQRPVGGRHLSDKVLRALNAGLRTAYVTKQTRSLTYARLYRRASRTPRCTPGAFQFPFGVVRYVDAGTLPFLYQEIFADRVYDVGGGCEAPLIVDCGGNIGLSTIWFKQRYPQSRITVFEADPTIANVLCQNVRTLGLEDVQVRQGAVSARSGTVTFKADGSLGGRVTAGSGLTVHCIRLSDHIDEMVDLLKLDIEGSEFDVVADLCATGKIDRVRNIVCEVHGRPDVQPQLAELWCNLTRAGFTTSINWAMTAPPSSDPAVATPFPSVASAEFVFHLYAWRSATASPSTNSVFAHQSSERALDAAERSGRSSDADQ